MKMQIFFKPKYVDTYSQNVFMAFKKTDTKGSTLKKLLVATFFMKMLKYFGYFRKCLLIMA